MAKKKEVQDQTSEEVTEQKEVQEQTPNELLATKLLPRFHKLIVPQKEGNDYRWFPVDKENVTEVDVYSILEFWDDLITKQPDFNKESAIDSIFTRVE